MSAEIGNISTCVANKPKTQTGSNGMQRRFFLSMRAHFPLLQKITTMTASPCYLRTDGCTTQIAANNRVKSISTIHFCWASWHHIYFEITNSPTTHNIFMDSVLAYVDTHQLHRRRNNIIRACRVIIDKRRRYGSSAMYKTNLLFIGTIHVSNVGRGRQ